ncbi:MAG TPA: hypothetical protein VGN47_06835 [Blastococcus sp.]|jgi:hypothetical protein|nr:hypothetical protein [Blastococcus sp.]
MDLDEVADELYDVPPEEFVALRKARQDDARADGDRALAADIGALAKPSVAAWVCNLLVRAHREEIGGLVELGELLREAQQNLAGEQLRALNTQRSQLIAALSRQAASLARARGRAVGSAVSGQVEDTLRAALADPEAAEALLTGRLTAPMSYSGGLGTTRRPDLRLVRSPRPEPGPARERATSPRPTSADERRAARQRAQEEAQRAAEERRRRALEEARQAADEAIRNADEAREAAAEERRRVDELDQQRAELQARAATLSDELAEAERAAADATARLKSAERRRKAADHEAADAEAARDRAVAHAEELAAE